MFVPHPYREYSEPDFCLYNIIGAHTVASLKCTARRPFNFYKLARAATNYINSILLRNLVYAVVNTYRFISSWFIFLWVTLIYCVWTLMCDANFYCNPFVVYAVNCKSLFWNYFIDLDESFFGVSFICILIRS